MQKMVHLEYVIKHSLWVIGVFSLIFLNSCTIKPSDVQTVEQALLSLPKDFKPVVLVQFPDIFTKQDITDGSATVENYIEDKRVNISISLNQKEYDLHAKLFKGEEDSDPIMLMYTELKTTIMENQELLTGMRAHTPCFGFQIRVLMLVNGRWEDHSSKKIPKEFFTYLQEKCDFILTDDKNKIHLGNTFVGDQLVFFSQSFRNDRLISIEWKNSQFTINEKNDPIKQETKHPAFRKLAPRVGDVGMLLGMATKTGYKTYFILKDKDTVKVEQSFPYLVIPPKEGESFYFLDKVEHSAFSFCQNANCQHRISSLAYTDLHTLLETEKEAILAQLKSQIVSKDRCMSTLYNEYVVMASRGYFVKRYKNAQWGCSEVSEMTFDTTYHTFQKLDPSLKVNFSDHFSEAVRDSAYSEIYLQAVRMLFDQMSDDEVRKLIRPDNIELFLKREDGVVNAYANSPVPVLNRKIYGTNNFRKIEFGLGKAPSSLYMNNYFPIDYHLMESYIKNLRDVMVSPLDNIVFILTNDHLRGVSPSGDMEVFELEVDRSSDTQVIMTEWYTGADLILMLEKLKEINEPL